LIQRVCRSNHARLQPVAQRAEFRLADAQNLPFPDGVFDIVASALVINFIPDRALALRHMRRVARSDGVVAGYV
jgi:ubiquinone/menaquinone biosynthesis C-methylase UbiE